MLAAPLLRRPDAVEPGRAAAPLRLLQDREVEPDAGGPKVGASRLAVAMNSKWLQRKGSTAATNFRRAVNTSVNRVTRALAGSSHASFHVSVITMPRSRPDVCGTNTSKTTGNAARMAAARISPATPTVHAAAHTSRVSDP